MRKSLKRGVKLGGGRGGGAAEGGGSWKKGLEEGGLGRIRGRASFSAIDGERDSRERGGEKRRGFRNGCKNLSPYFNLYFNLFI